MKILYTIAGFYRAAGMERVLAGKARWLSEHGCEVVIVTTEQRGRPAVFTVPEGVRFIDLGIGYEENNGSSLFSKIFCLPLKKIRHRRALKAVLADEKPDVAISMFCGDEGFLPRIADCATVLECHFTRRKRVLYGRRGLWAVADRIRSSREPRKALAFDHFVVLTEEDRGYWLADCPSLDRIIRVIPNPRTFDPEEIAALRESETVGGIVLAAGRYSYQKHPEALVEAWGMIPEPEREGWTLRIAGDGELRPALEAMDVSGVVLGPASDMKKEYASASVFALSSRYEGLPMVLLEAQSAGLPVVSFSCNCGPRDVLTDGVDGFLVPEGDVAALAERLRTLMKDPGLREEMGRRALENSEKYREDNIMKIWTDLFGDSGAGDQKTVVVSAVSLRKGGTLRILQQTLEYLSGRDDVRTVALVHDRSLCGYPGIEYMEIPWATRSWAHRLWCEYVTMHRISKDLARNGGPVDLWLSLHDTTPRVVAKEQEVYCHTSFPFLKLRLRDFVMDPKIPAFRFLTPLYYKIGARKNSSIIVQQEWFADALSRLMRVPRGKFRVIPPAGAPALTDKAPKKIFFNPDSPRELSMRIGELVRDGAGSFFFASTPDCHKNFETFLEAVRLFNSRGSEGLGIDPLNVSFVITVRGDENRYARWLHRRWGCLPNVDFHGLMGRGELYEHYRKADCFVFPSRVETWGLPISEYASVHPDGILLLADLPYARGHRILQLGKFYPIRGGIEKLMWDLTRGVSARGLACDMLCACLRKDMPVATGEEALAGVADGSVVRETEYSVSPGDFGSRVIRFNGYGRCICVPASDKKAATMIAPAMVGWLRRHASEYDLIHVHHPDPMACLALRLSGYRGRVFVHWHSDILKQKLLLRLYTPLQNWLVRRAERIIGTTPVYVAQSPWLQKYQDKICCLPIGIEDNIRLEPAPQTEPSFIFSLGRLVGYKGYRYLIEAAKWLPDDYRIEIGGSGPQKAELQALIDAEGLGGKVLLLGFVSDEDVRRKFNSCDLFVLPSVMKTEAFGIVQIEAMSCSKPVIATTIPGSGTSWVNAHGESGLNVPPCDAKALADAILAITADRAARNGFAQRARTRFEHLFTLDAMVDGYLKML